MCVSRCFIDRVAKAFIGEVSLPEEKEKRNRSTGLLSKTSLYFCITASSMLVLGLQRRRQDVGRLRHSVLLRFFLNVHVHVQDDFDVLGCVNDMV